MNLENITLEEEELIEAKLKQLLIQFTTEHEFGVIYYLDGQYYQHSCTTEDAVGLILEKYSIGYMTPHIALSIEDGRTIAVLNGVRIMAVFEIINGELTIESRRTDFGLRKAIELTPEELRASFAELANSLQTHHESSTDESPRRKLH